MRPALAESWTVSPDQLSWTFHLRRGVTFHDGSPFTADDVVYSYRRIIDQELANADKLSAVTGITAADPSTVVITLKQPTPSLLTNLGGSRDWQSCSDAMSRVARSQGIPSARDHLPSRARRAGTPSS
jgi:ABC-type transport system substrate-binding protein